MPDNFIFMAFYFVLSKGQYIPSPLLGRTLRALTATDAGSVRELVLRGAQHPALRARTRDGGRPHDGADVPHGRADDDVQERGTGGGECLFYGACFREPAPLSGPLGSQLQLQLGLTCVLCAGADLPVAV